MGIFRERRVVAPLTDIPLSLKLFLFFTLATKTKLGAPGENHDKLFAHLKIWQEAFLG